MTFLFIFFPGQLKSKVTCKVCGHESVKFDPFTFLSLPLPMVSVCLKKNVNKQLTSGQNVNKQLTCKQKVDIW